MGPVPTTKMVLGFEGMVFGGVCEMVGNCRCKDDDNGEQKKNLCIWFQRSRYIKWRDQERRLCRIKV